MYKVYLSPSTQDDNVGAGNYGTEEYRMNLIADVTQAILKKYVTVYRNKPEWSVGQSVRDSNSKNVDLHFAIHSNAGGGTGCEVFCHKTTSQGYILAKIVYAKVSSLTPSKDRGIKEGYKFYSSGSSIYELEQTLAPAVLIEVNFHDNAKDAKWIIDNIAKLGEAIAYSILEYLKISVNDTDKVDIKKELDKIKEAVKAIENSMN